MTPDEAACDCAALAEDGRLCEKHTRQMSEPSEMTPDDVGRTGYWKDRAEAAEARLREQSQATNIMGRVAVNLGEAKRIAEEFAVELQRDDDHDYALLEARLREVEAERDALREALAGPEQLAQARRADEDRAYRAVLTRLREVEAERDKAVDHANRASDDAVDLRWIVRNWKVVLRDMLRWWDIAEGPRGCYSKASEHDCRCLKGLGFSDECGCGRDGLGEAMEAARAALEGKYRG
jgi:hypothetical protein